MRQWNSVERREIASLLKRGLTAGQIARRYEGRSRSAIVGLVNRDPSLREIGFQHSKTFTRQHREQWSSALDAAIATAEAEPPEQSESLSDWWKDTLRLAGIEG